MRRTDSSEHRNKYDRINLLVFIEGYFKSYHVVHQIVFFQKFGQKKSSEKTFFVFFFFVKKPFFKNLRTLRKIHSTFLVKFVRQLIFWAKKNKYSDKITKLSKFLVLFM